MKNNSGSATTLVTTLAFIALALGALVGWQWHQRQMQTVLLENLSLKEEIKELETQTFLCQEGEEVTESAQLATESSELELTDGAASPAATSAF